MANVFGRFLLFLSSYFPLAVIFFVLFLSKDQKLAVIVLTIGVVGLIGTAVYLRIVRKLGAVQIDIASIHRRDGEAMSYIVTYVIPFLALPFSDWRQALALLIFFFVLAVLYVNSNMIHINPMLNLEGYHLYEVTLSDGGIHALITRRRIKKGEKVNVVKLGDDILMEKRE